MIRFILLQNRQGKTRLSKWYVPFNAAEKNKIESEIHRAVVSRDPRFTNFLEYRNYKIIYRRYVFFHLLFKFQDTRGYSSHFVSISTITNYLFSNSFTFLSKSSTDTLAMYANWILFFISIKCMQF